MRYATITFHIVTLFPEAFESYLGSSIIARALRDKKIRVQFYNPRDFAKNKWRRVDQRPYGGGPGMVLEAESILKAVSAALRKAGSLKREVGSKKKYFNSSSSSRLSLSETNVLRLSEPNDLQPSTFKPVIYFFDRSGKQFTNKDARALAKSAKDIVFICGHYEGVDARVQKILKAKKISIGPYTLTGGELPAMTVVDAVSRQIPGVLGKFESVEEERIASSEVYTRPEILKWKGKTYRVPKVLLTGHHKKIEEWKAKRTKRAKSVAKTR